MLRPNLIEVKVLYTLLYFFFILILPTLSYLPL